LQERFAQIDLEHAVSKQPLQTVMFLLQFLEPLHLVDRHTTVSFAPAVKRVLGAAVFTTDRRDAVFILLGLLNDLVNLLGRRLVVFIGSSLSEDPRIMQASARGGGEGQDGPCSIDCVC
jgi:hypothetical protein